MAGEPSRRHILPIVITGLLIAASTATAGLLQGPSDPLAASQATTAMTGFQEAMTWSQTHHDTLIAALVPGAGLQGWHHEAITAYHDGHTWAKQRLATSDRATLATALTATLEAHNLPSAPTNLDRLPAAYISPVATLLQAQQATALAARSLPNPDLTPWAFTRALGQDSAWLLGALEATLPALRTAAATSPIPQAFALDTLGMILIGSHGDDTYHPHELAPDVIWNGTLLVVEPGGNDTYHVNVASRATVTLPPLPGEERCLPEDQTLDEIPCKRATTHPSLAIELGGDDRYKGQTANARAIGTIGLLYEDAGNDTYGNFQTENAIGHANTAASFVLEMAGTDTYRTKWLGLADAFQGIAIMDDREGDDTYYGHVGLGGGFTHATSAWPGSLATLRDWQGDDEYRAHSAAYASALGDGHALLLDDAGADTYNLSYHGLTFGDRYNGGDGIIEHPTNHALAYFLDGGGDDAYQINEIIDGITTGPVGNDLVDVRDGPNREPWGIFVDCETPDEASFPCEHVQDQVLVRMVENA